MSILTGKNILITGGTGSIGSTLAKEALENHAPKQIRIFSRDDSKQFQLIEEIGKDAPVNLLIGDVREKDRLARAMENIDIVFHAAALKHVHLCERNPFEAMRTNVLGTQNVIDCALDAGVDRVVYISTDKAANPTNVLGATKLLGEHLMLTSYFYKGGKQTKFCCVRFGNVLWSRGSVLPLFVRQVKSGKPLTITDPNMTRFFMPLKEAAALSMQAAEMTKENEIFVFKMPATRIGDVAEAIQEIMIEEKLAEKPVPVNIIGRKEGERVHEKLLTVEESERALETDRMFIIRPNYVMAAPLKLKLAPADYPGAKPANIREYTTTSARLLSKPELKELLKEGGLYREYAK